MLGTQKHSDGRNQADQQRSPADQRTMAGQQIIGNNSQDNQTDCSSQLEFVSR